MKSSTAPAPLIDPDEPTLVASGLALPAEGPAIRLAAALSLLATLATTLASLALAAPLLPWQGTAALASGFGLLLAGIALATGLQIAQARLLRRLVDLHPGTYRHHSVPWRHWRLLHRLMAGALAMQRLTPFSGPPAAWLRRLGTPVGRGAVVARSVRVDDPALVEIGTDVVIDAAVHLVTASPIDGRVHLGRIRIGNDVVIGSGTVIHPGVEIGAGAVLVAGSVVMPGSRIPAGCVWGGHPARPVHQRNRPLQPDDQVVFAPQVLRIDFRPVRTDHHAAVFPA